MAQDPRALLQKVGSPIATLHDLSSSLTYTATQLTVTSQADKALQGASGGFSLFGGRTEKYENAADLYTQAANAFRMQKQGPFHSQP